MDAVVPILSVALAFVALGAGYWLGRRHEREAQAEARERLTRVDPPDREPGLPTNRTGPPARITQAHIKDARWSEDGDMQR